MTTRARDVETDIIQLAANNLTSEGYTVVLQPKTSDLPPELKDFQLDAIAIGKKPNLVIEVTREGKNSEQANRIRDALAGNLNWKLRVIYDRADTSAPAVRESIGSVKEAIALVQRLSKDDTRAALLVSWASLEALARVIQPSNFSRPQTPGRIIEQLASLGYIAPSEAAFLRVLMNKRNEFIHGRLSIGVSELEIQKTVELLNDLVGAAERQEGDLPSSE